MKGTPEGSAATRRADIARIRERLDTWLESEPGSVGTAEARRFLLMLAPAARLGVPAGEVERRLAQTGDLDVVDRLVREESALRRSPRFPRSRLDVWLRDHDDHDLPHGTRYLQELAESDAALWDVVDVRAGEWAELRPRGTRQTVTRVGLSDTIGAIEPGDRLLARVVAMPHGAELGASVLLVLPPGVALLPGSSAPDLVEDVLGRWVAHRLNGTRGGGTGRPGAGSDATDRQRVLERVRKLYAMSQETEASPHEAEIALRRCQSLMAKFGISEADLETSAFGTAASPRRSVAMHARYLGSAVAALHDVLFVTGGLDGVEFRGYEIDVDVARMTFEYLENAVERALATRRRAGDFPAGRSAAYDYRIGFAAEVSRRVQAMVAERERAERAASPTGTALTVRKREIVDRECGQGLRTNRSTHRGVRDREAAAAGRADGARVSLDPQVRGGADAKRLGRG